MLQKGESPQLGDVLLDTLSCSSTELRKTTLIALGWISEADIGSNGDQSNSAATQFSPSMFPTVPTSLITKFGYWAVAGIVGLESVGLPLPGEATLIAAALYAGTTKQLNIWLVIASASLGAIFGDNVGFWLGRSFFSSMRAVPFSGLRYMALALTT